MTEPPKIAGAGIACIDYIVVAPQIPWGDTASVSDFHIQGGGLIATALVACARLGARCECISLLGDDSIGDQIVDDLVSEGVSVSGIARIPGGGSPFSFIHVDERSGERTIFHRDGIGLGWSPEASRYKVASDREAAEAMPARCFSFPAGCGALLVDDIYPELALAAANLGREQGIPVVADLIPSAANAELLRHVDALIAPRHFARRIGLDDNLDAALDEIHRLGPTTAVITLGAEGLVYSDPAGRGRGEAFEVKVVDTTGAGDTFHGAFCYGLASGWDTARCCEFASAVAAIKCTKPGGRAGLPSLDQTMRFLDERTWR